MEQTIQLFSQVGIGVITLIILTRYMQQQATLQNQMNRIIDKITDMSIKVTGESYASQQTAITALGQSDDMINKVGQLADTVDHWVEQMELYNAGATMRTQQINAIEKRLSSIDERLLALEQRTRPRGVQ